MKTFRKFFAAVICACGCAGGATETNQVYPNPETREDIDDEAKAVQQSEPETVATNQGSGTISRSALQALLAEGPAALLAAVRTAPARVGGRFVGFRIEAFTRGPPEVVDLRVGDIILGVNGRAIERPEDYYEVFQQLASAAKIEFELLRDGNRRILVYPIVD